MHRNREINRSVDGSKNFGALVQLVRIRACHARGQGFESPTHRQKGRSKGLPFLFLCCVYFLRRGADVDVFCCSCGVCALCKHSAHSPSPTIAKRCPPRLVSSNLLFWRCVGNLELRRGYLGSLFRTTPRGDLRVSLGDGFAIRVPMGVACMYLFFCSVYSDLLCG